MLLLLLNRSLGQRGREGGREGGSEARRLLDAKQTHSDKLEEPMCDN